MSANTEYNIENITGKNFTQEKVINGVNSYEFYTDWTEDGLYFIYLSTDYSKIFTEITTDNGTVTYVYSIQ